MCLATLSIVARRVCRGCPRRSFDLGFFLLQLIFVSDLIFIFLIIVYLVLNHLSSFVFQFQPFALDFYIRFGPYSFNYDVVGFESYIELICL